MEQKPFVSIDSKSELQFPKRGSSYWIGTAGQKAFGHGDTIQRAHLSEASRYPDLNRIRNGIEEAVGMFGQIDIETTANGREEFYDMWQLAKAGRSSYTPIFIPWFIDNEYSVENLSEEDKQGLSQSVQEMFLIPDVEFMNTLDENERELIKRVELEWKIKLSVGQLKWRRYKIWDKNDLFWQEYPEDDVSCFLQSGRTVFSKITTDVSKRIPFDDFERWQVPAERKNEYLRTGKAKLLYGGLDGAEGTLTGDRHVFSVIDVDGSVGKAVFEIASNDPIDVFDKKVADICKKFNILLGIEKNGVGLAHCIKMKELGIRFFEFETTAANRPVMITELEEAYRKKDLIETYPEAENEARDMEYTSNNRAEHKSGKHDDRVFARAIAWQMRKIKTPSVTYV